LKLSALAFCYQDGGADLSKLSDEQKAKVVKSMPNVIELLSYTFYTQNSALGVFFEFSDYKRFIERTDEYENVPSPIMQSLKTLGEAILFTGIFLVGSQYFNINMCYSDDYATWSFGYKVFYYHVAMGFKRFFYYGPFSFTTGAI
jgi:hypothetical protein